MQREALGQEVPKRYGSPGGVLDVTDQFTAASEARPTGLAPPRPEPAHRAETGPAPASIAAARATLSSERLIIRCVPSIAAPCPFRERLAGPTKTSGRCELDSPLRRPDWRRR